MIRPRTLAIFFVFIAVCLFLYSFTQVDLSLTLSRSSIYQTIEKNFQHIGWYDRPLSTTLYLLIAIALTASYSCFLYLSLKKKITRKLFWITLIAVCGILVFSYNAFSYDLFNYIFDAKIFTHYHLNPYMYKALDFPGDPMLSFMRWTHRTYPYGPMWLGITIPLSFIGGNIFLLTFFIFKLAMASFFLGSVYLIEKILDIVDEKRKILGIIFFAFNPLVLIECLVSAHNDISMMFFVLLGIYLILKKKVFLSIFFVAVSGLIKFTGVSILPALLLFMVNFRKNLGFSFDKFISLSIVSAIVTFGYVITKTQVQPWYLLWILPLIALSRPTKFVMIPTIILSFSLCILYIPFIQTGNWDGIKPVLEIETIILAVCVAFIIAYAGKSFLRGSKSV